MSGPSWLALVAAVWWAALLNPAQPPSFAAGIFAGIDLPAAIVSADRHMSAHTSARHRADGERHSNSPAVVASAVAFQLAAEPIQWFVATAHRLAARPAPSPAQPRAPPADTVAHAG